MVAKVHPCGPDGRDSEPPYHVRSDTLHKAPAERETPRQRFNDVTPEGLLQQRCSIDVYLLIYLLICSCKRCGGLVIMPENSYLGSFEDACQLILKMG